MPCVGTGARSLYFLVLVVTLARAADDQLAPLVSPNLSDPSNLQGAQLRPPKTSVLVGRSVGLRVRNCFPHTGDDGVPYYECNPEAVEGLGLLLEVVPASRWSVNGIEGGNGIVGRVSGDTIQALYTAPAAVPDPATVAVSAEIATEGSGKTLVAAEITVVESLVVVLANFVGSRREHGEEIDYSGTARLTFLPAEHFEGGIRFDLDPGPANSEVTVDGWDIRSDSITCHLVGTATRRSPDVPLSGNFFIYSTLNSYVFGAMFEMLGTVECKDGDSTYLEEVTPRVLLTTSPGPPNPGFQPLGDEEKFTGTLRTVITIDEDSGDSVDQTMDWTVWKD